jgi:LPS-assembly protein
MLRKGLLVLFTLLAGALPARAQAPNGCSYKWSVNSEQAISSEETHHTKLVRQVRIDCNDIQLFADEGELFTDTDRMRASGNVLFVSSSNRISADRLEFNWRTKTGTFYNASGIANLEARGVDRSFFGTQEPDAYFWGETIEKLGPKTYRIRRGGFSTCVQPTPRWELVSNEVTLTLEKHAFIKNAVLKVKDVPVFYLPAMYYPINKEDRATGFLIPVYGSSDIKGQTLSNAFFWAINRSQDATFYHSWYSKSGQSFGGEYRYVQSPGSTGNLQTTVVKEPESISYEQSNGTSNVVPGIDSYTVTGSVVQQLPARLRLSGNANYFSSLAAQQRYQQNIYNATLRNRSFGVNVAGNWNGNSISATVDHAETFSDDTNSTIRGSLPRVSFGRSEKKLGGSPFYFGATSEYVTLIRTGHTPTGDVPLGLSRMDVSPTIRFPYTRWQFLTFNSSVRYHETFWTDSQDPLNLNQVTGRLDEGIERHFFEFATSITGPVFTKIFNTPGSSYAQKWKHVIEPTLTVTKRTLIDNAAKIVVLESYDQIPGGDTQYIYGLSSRLYAKKESSREILSASLQQTYYTKEIAASFDPNYSSTVGTQHPPGSFSPLALQVHVSPTTITDATMRAEFDSKSQAMTQFALNGGMALGWTVVNAGWSLSRNIPVNPSLPITTASHFLNAMAITRRPGNGWSGAYGFNYDMKNKDFMNQRFIAHYNTQCCGLAIEFQKYNFGTRAGTVGVPTDHRFNLSFTLAGIGTFSDLFGAFGGQQTR